MIAIQFKEPPNEGIWKRWRRDCDRETEKLLAQIANGKVPVVSEIYRRKSIKDEFYFAVTGLFGGKCAYCESYLTDFQRPDIDHYRPKLGVTDASDAPVMVDYGDGNGPVAHRGYYWLAYSVSNLLPACQICNQPSRISNEKVGKHSRFPVEGQYAIQEDSVPTERPLIINPMQENPADHLEIDTESGRMNPRNGSRKGAETILIFGLNVRDQLCRNRAGVIKEVKALLCKIVLDPKGSVSAQQEIEQMKRGGGPYTAAVRAILDEIEPHLPIGPAATQPPGS